MEDARQPPEDNPNDPRDPNEQEVSWLEEAVLEVPEVDVSGLGLGSYLCRARMVRNLTLDQVAAYTGIKREFLVDLERDNLTTWPPATFDRENFLRSYAKAVGIDPREVIKRFRLQFLSNEPLYERRPAMRIGSRLAVVSAVVLSFIGGIFVGGYGAGRGADVPQAVTTPGRDAGDIAWAPPASAAKVSTPPLATSAAASPSPAGRTIRPANVEGEVMVVSTPPEARVTVNGVARGVTPVRVRYLKPGSYTIRVIQAGYPIHQRHVRITAEQPRQQVRVVLRRPANKSN